MPSPALLFVLTDGGRARFVERSRENGHYVTLEELDAGPRLKQLRSELRASPPVRTRRSAEPRRSAVGPEDFVRAAKEAFVSDVAERADELCRHRPFAGVVVAAPARLIGAFKAKLSPRTPIAGAIRKDLAKTPHRELGAWLNEIYVNPRLVQ